MLEVAGILLASMPSTILLVLGACCLGEEVKYLSW